MPSSPADHTQAIALAGLVAILVGVVVRLAHWTRPLRRRRRAWRLARREIDRHRISLGLRRREIEAAHWPRERMRFCRRQLRPLLDGAGLGPLFDGLQGKLEREIDRASASRMFRQGEQAAAGPGGDYERHCAILLRKAGWDAELTAGSGDQGSDILARRRRRLLVVQCKCHGRPVGNKAVQEVYAAQRHHGAHLAAVVSNAGYTKGARALAETTGVRLLHHHDLHAL